MKIVFANGRFDCLLDAAWDNFTRDLLRPCLPISDGDPTAGPEEKDVEQCSADGDSWLKGRAVQQTRRAFSVVCDDDECCCPLFFFWFPRPTAAKERFRIQYFVFSTCIAVPALVQVGPDAARLGQTGHARSTALGRL